MVGQELAIPTATPPRQREMSPSNSRSPLQQLEMARNSMWNCANTQSTSEPQNEPINLSEPSTTMKRELEGGNTPPPKRLRTDTPHHQSQSPSQPQPQPQSPKNISSATHIKINSRGKFNCYEFIE